MKSRRLQDLLTIERVARTVSPAGTVSEGWTVLASVRCEVLKRRLYERLEAFGEQEENTVGFRVRNIPGIEIGTADRLIFDGQAFNIVDVLPVERGRVIEIIAKRITT